MFLFQLSQALKSLLLDNRFFVGLVHTDPLLFQSLFFCSTIDKLQSLAKLNRDVIKLKVIVRDLRIKIRSQELNEQANNYGLIRSFQSISMGQSVLLIQTASYFEQFYKDNVGNNFNRSIISPSLPLTINNCEVFGGGTVME